MPIERRGLLRTGATIAAVSSVAGVSAAVPDARGRSRFGVNDRTELRQVPDYGRWIPAASELSDPSAGEIVYSVRTSAVLGTEDDSQPPADPMLRNPVTLGSVAYLSWLGLGQLGIHEPVIGPVPDEGSRDPADVPTDRTLAVGNDTVVYIGSFDTAAIQSAVDAGAFTETSDGVYAHDQQERFVTWADGAVVVSPSVSLAATVRDAGTGDATSRHEADDDWAWLLDTAGDGGFTYAVLSESGSPDQFSDEGGDMDLDFSMFEGSRGFAQSASVDGSAFTNAAAAVVYGSADDASASDLAAAFGADASDTSTSQNGTRVSMTAAYDGSQAGGADAATTTGASTATPDESGSEGDDTGDGDGGDAGGGSGDDGDGSENDDGDGGANDDGDDGGGGTDGDEDGSSAFGPGLGVLATLGGIAGGGYLLARRDDEEGS